MPVFLPDLAISSACRYLLRLFCVTLFGSLLLADLAQAATAAQRVERPVASQAESLPKRRVLLLHGWGQGQPWPEAINTGVRKGFAAAGQPVELFVENLDEPRLHRRIYPALARFIERKYSATPPDLVMVSDGIVFDFVARYRERLFPDAPLVFANSLIFSEDKVRALHGFEVADLQDYAATLALIRQVLPKTRVLAFVGSFDTSEAERGIQQALVLAREQFPVVHDYSKLSLDGALARVRELPADSAVMLGITARNARGESVGVEALTRSVSQASEVPVFGNFAIMLKHGALGGRMISGEGRGMALAAMASRLLAGEELAPVPDRQKSQQADMFAYPALKRFGLVDSPLLPADSLIVDRPPSLNEANPQLVIGGLVVFGLLLVLVFLLLLALFLSRRGNRRLEEDESHYRSLFEETPLPMLVYDLQGLRILAVNQAFNRDFGYSLEDVLGQPVTLLTLEEQRDKVQAAITAKRRPEDSEVSCTCWPTQHRDGSLLQVEYIGQATAWGGRSARLVMMRDVTQRLQTEAALKSSEHRMTHIIDCCPLSILVLDADLNVSHWNQALTRMTGLEASDMVGRPLDPRLRYQGRPLLLEGMVMGMSLEEMQRWPGAHIQPSTFLPEGLESEAYRPDLERWIRAFAVPLRAPDGRLLGAIQTNIDITAVKRARSDLQRLNSELEQRVEQRTQELSKAHEDLQRAMQQLVQSEKLAALGELVAGVAHELNTPIGNAMTVVTTLQDHLQALNVDVQANSLRRSHVSNFIQACSDACLMLERNTRRAADLVTSFKQVAVDQTSVRRRRFSLAEALDETLRTLAPLYKNQPVKVHLQVPGELQLDSYPGPLEQVITNLIGNAVTHARGDHPQLQINISAEPVSLDGVPGVSISVRDDGIGMSEEVARRVFDPFFTTRLGQGGSGLGLYVVHNLASGVLGGTIELITAPGQGCCFILRIPLHAQQYTPS